MTTTTLSSNTAPSSRWIHELALPCAKYPQGMTGILEITSYTKRGPVTAAYMVEPIRHEGKIVGWHLDNLHNDQVYDIDTQWGAGQWICDCGDCCFRDRECKHSKALRAALQAGNQF